MVGPTVRIGAPWRPRSKPGPMIHHRPDRLPARAPTVPPPRPFAERRVSHRRTEDQVSHREKVLLARALDVLASDSAAEERLAGLLRLLARTVGARRVAVIADGMDRRAAVAIDPGEDPAEGEALAAWLDVNAPRTRAHRAAAGRAPISVVVGPAVSASPDDPLAADGPADLNAEWPAGRIGTEPRYAVLAIPTAGDVALGFEFARASDARRVADRLPPTLARHAAVALALVTGQLAGGRELAALRSRDVERSAFVSTIAHELRTPLTGLGGYLQLLLAGRVGDPDVEREFLERSRAIVGSMGELVDDLLELSRLESGTLGLEIGPFSIAEAVARVATVLVPIAMDRDIQVTTVLPPRLRVANGDRRRVEQILTNLAANGLKFTPPGGAVQITGRMDGPVAIVVVRDDGAGIPADDQARIFERFQRLAGHESISGTGLGLPIARDLARRMNGELDLASVPGSGSAFILALPGPAAVDPVLLHSILSDAVAREEVLLHERAVRRGVPSGAPGRVLAGRAERSTDRSHRRLSGKRLRVLPEVRPEIAVSAPARRCG